MSLTQNNLTTKRFKSVGGIFCQLAEMLRPPERLSVSAAAEKYRYVNSPGAYVGPWKNDTAYYMVEPMDTFASRRYNGMIFVGPAQSGKALALSTPIDTPTGWKTMGELEVGDYVFDENEKPVKVLVTSDVMHDHPCYDVCFSGAGGVSVIRADAEHLWTVRDIITGGFVTVTTDDLVCGIDVVARHDCDFTLMSKTPAPSVPVRCIGVDSPTHLYLAGTGRVPTHNTDSLVINALVYSVLVEPLDLMLVCPTMTAARDFSIRRIDRLHRHSSEVGAMMLPGADSDNKFDKSYRNGLLFTLSWPTPTELAGKPIGRVILTDRDRMPDDVDGDGEPFDLASKRTTTFGSYAMAVAESSPSRPVENPRWIPKTPHEAPPTKGIMALYNRGDRRRWYWPCPHCDAFFEGTFDLLEINEKATGTNYERAQTVRMRCPHCRELIHSDERNGMQSWGIWLKDGQGIDKKGRVFGPEPRTSIASFWMNGVAAAFTSWAKLYAMFMDANDHFERTGSEDALVKFFNTDIGVPYVPKSLYDIRSPEVIKSRAEDLGERVVPLNVRFLIATVDVQKNMFVVQVHGILPGTPCDTVIVDRFNIVKSDRQDDDGEKLWVKPATYSQDWHKITELVIKKEYPLGDDSGRMMSIRFTLCDSGGEEGVTGMAYTYYRELREQNLHRRFCLSKGTGTPEAPRTRLGYPDSGKKDKMTAARGDVPVLFLHANVIKDTLNGRLDCVEPGKGMIRFPNWLSDNFYNELCAETRTAKGWENLNKERNEAWDLLYMSMGCVISEFIRVEQLDWNNPPLWAAEWDKNDLVRTVEAEPRFAAQGKAFDFAQFGKALA